MMNVQGLARCTSCQIFHYAGCKEVVERGLLLDLWEVAKDWYEQKNDEHPTVRAMAEHELSTVIEAIQKYHERQALKA